jgi:hypothetical protein
MIERLPALRSSRALTSITLTEEAGQSDFADRFSGYRPFHLQPYFTLFS